MNWSLRRRWGNLRTRLIAAFILTVLLPLVGTSLYGNWITSRVLQSRAVDGAQADLRLRRLQLEEALHGPEEDLLFLSRLGSTMALVDDPTTMHVAAAQQDFADFLATHPEVFQARYLNDTGMEVVRVDAGTDGLIWVPPDQLQNKADRYYFTRTSTLPSGTVYVSPIDLNREYGRIQEPHTPTIRYATPVFTAGGARAGIVVLNLYAAPVLLSARGDTLSLLDDAGNVLLHPNPEYQWSGPADLNTGVTGQALYADDWSRLTATDQGVLLPVPASAWQSIWEFLNPLVAERDDRHVLVFESVRVSDNHWRLINDLPRATVLAPVSDFRVTAVLIVLWAMLLAAGMAIVFARQIAGPIQELTGRVRGFAQAHGAVLSPRHLQTAPVRDEIAALAAAFQDMATALERHMSQLSQLNLAGQHIAARLEERDVITAISTAVHRLLPVEFLAITLDEAIDHREGREVWSTYRDADLLGDVLPRAMTAGTWTTMALEATDATAGYLCCAPICVAGQLGLIELYGQEPLLGSQAAGELLGTLAVQVSIALENAALVRRLARRRAELQTLLQQLLTAQEEERRRIAYDIHDGLIQMLVGSRLQFANYDADRERVPDEASQALQRGMDGLAAAIAEARRVIEGLRPAALDDLGLAATARHIVEMACAEAGCEMSFAADLAEERLPATVETTAFRILQEAVTNARNHAAMKHLSVRLNQANGTLTLTITDDGQGFDLSDIETTRHGGFGVRSMQERARLIGGECIIERQAQGGTSVRVTLPLHTGGTSAPEPA